ncbi:glycosyl hydrolase family 10 [Moniliophthora roreri MCA 2997]|uniref:Beta-xylanase n=2 Tax=Moniliophthora roreri TaxID=221103 RepID=V2Y6H5_MONRO|nr:glycosyl hydrolase family 10 [Moniliophthora roreri MCA 2997]KAI3603745.1 glycosyl hydrolase family 10 [Moniliophthora roreri]
MHPLIFPILALLSLIDAFPAYGGPVHGNVVLKDLAKPRFFGAAANTTFLFNDEKYTEIAEKQFSIFTPENEMKWESIEPQQNVFNFTGADEIVRFAHSVSAKVRGHTFVWGNQLAPWVNDTLSGRELDQALKNHIHTILDHYRGKLYSFDIINELISDTPTENAVFKSNIWTQKFAGGEEVMKKALTYARETDKEIKLYYNDYGIENIGPKSNALIDIIKRFKESGVPLDGIGFQCHFGLGQVPSDLQENLQRFADLDLDVAITELDINMRGPANETSLAQQAEDYHKVASACVAVKRCVSLTIWGVSDDHSWLPNGHVLPWDGNKQPKPAFYALAGAFKNE